MSVPDVWVDRLAALAIECRPHRAPIWDMPGTIAAIRKVQHLAFADVAAACIRAGSTRDLRSPAAISDTTSSAWRERLTEPTPTKPVICPTHGTQHHGGICPSCRADQLANDTTGPPGRRLPADQAHDITTELHNRRAARLGGSAHSSQTETGDRE